MSTVVPFDLQNTHVRKGANQVPANPDPDEDVLIDFAMFRSRMMRRFSADGDFDAEEQGITAAFDASFQIVSTRYQVRRSFESIMRNGLTKRTGDQARHAGIVVMVDNGQRVSNVIQLFPDEPQNAA